MIEDIKRNIESEINMLREISAYSNKLGSIPQKDAKLLLSAIKSLRENMKIINDTIPKLLNEVSLIKKLSPNNAGKKIRLERVSYNKGKSELNAMIPISDKSRFFKELDIRERYIKKLRKSRKGGEEEHVEFKAASGYLKLANKFFLNTANNWIRKGYFKKLSKDLKKANIEILFHSYVAMIFMSVLLSIFAGIFLAVFLRLRKSHRTS